MSSDSDIEKLSGTPKSMLDTPVFLIDLDTMETNIAKMADYFASRPCNLRPHMKHHKTPEIAQLQLSAGAIGVCCQKLGEAEVMVAAGITDILVTYEIVGSTKIHRLMNLNKNADVKVTVDDASNVSDLSDAAVKHGVTLGVLVDVNVGQNRCGVPPGGKAVDLAKIVSKSPGLNLRGVNGYEGHLQAIVNRDERAEKASEAMAWLMETATAIQKSGIEVDIVSAGGTGTYNTTGNYPGVNEIQAGSYVFMDASYLKITNDFETSGTVLATVISKPTSERAILDSGMKAISTDQWPPLVLGMPGIQICGVSDEHLTIRLTDSDSRQVRPGDKIELIPGHNDTTVNLHSHLFGVRNETLETVWEVGARGRIR